MIDVGIYLLMVPFIFFNHRWAMIVFWLLYGLGKVFVMLEGMGSPLMHIVFLAFASGLTFKAVLVAAQLKRRR